MEATSSVSPKIVLLYDLGHEIKLQSEYLTKLRSLDVNEKIVFFCESRIIEDQNLGQYSIELLHRDEAFSTASSCQMLIALILAGSGEPALMKNIFGIMYGDSYFKQLFLGNHFLKYIPGNYGLSDQNLPFNSLSWQAQNAINKVKELFKSLDNDIKGLRFKEKEDLIESKCKTCFYEMGANPLIYDVLIFAHISEAVAMIKSTQACKKQGSTFQAEREVTVDKVNRLFFGQEDEIDEELMKFNFKLRTNFQAQKVIRVVERLMKSPESQELLFVVRDGVGHREQLTQQLQAHFGTDCVKELLVDEGSADELLDKIRGVFSN